MAKTAAERMRDMRARQAAAGVPPRPPGPRDADDLMLTHVNVSLTALDLPETDSATAELAREYARAIDASENVGYSMRWLAPLLLDVLESLGATPAARAKIKTGRPRPSGPPNRLQQMRDARAAADASANRR